MNKGIIFSSVAILFLGLNTSLFGQSFTNLGFLPRVNYTKPLDDKLSFNGVFFSEIDLADNTVGEVLIPRRVINLTFIAGLAYKFKSDNILTFGYLYRLIDPFEDNARIEHRLIQQYIRINHWGSWRIRHHLRAEQRFIESATTNGDFNSLLRLSYSFAWDVPLEGKYLDDNEFYLNSVSSYFVQPSRPRTAFNNLNEFYLGLGYKTKKIGRFEIGPEAKISARNIDKDLQTLIFMNLIWYPK